MRGPANHRPASPGNNFINFPRAVRDSRALIILNSEFRASQFVRERGNRDPLGRNDTNASRL